MMEYLPLSWKNKLVWRTFPSFGVGISLCLPPCDIYITTVSGLALKELMFPITRHWHRQKGKSSSFCFKIHHTSNKYKQLQCRIGAKRNQWCYELQLRGVRVTWVWDQAPKNETMRPHTGEGPLLVTPGTSTATTPRTWGGSLERWPFPFSFSVTPLRCIEHTTFGFLEPGTTVA